MATINISIHDSASQQGPNDQLKAMAVEELTPASGGSAPVDEGNEASSISGPYLEGAVSANGLVDIGAPPAWLHDAIAAHKAAASQEGAGNDDSNTDGGAAPIE